MPKEADSFVFPKARSLGTKRKLRIKPFLEEVREAGDNSQSHLRRPANRLKNWLFPDLGNS